MTCCASWTRPASSPSKNSTSGSAAPSGCSTRFRIWSELWNAGLDDRQFLSARIAMCEEAMRRFSSNDGLMVENRRRALAESYFELDETDKAEALYLEGLDADPGWGWGRT